MLFNSYEFLFLFLPATLAVFFVLSGTRHQRMAAAWLALASIFFYGYWNPRYVFLLLASIAVNFGIGQAIMGYRVAKKFRHAKMALLVAVSANLVALGYFKYANFFVDSLNAVGVAHLTLPKIILPIGISFFTFTQIAFLVDTYSGKVREPGIVHYTLFVTFFPHLIAGPVLHHAEMMPQFARDSTYRFNLDNFKLGAVYFFIGLFKKVVLADTVAVHVAGVYDVPVGSPVPTLAAAWLATIAYSVQLYFDFSGYSDMAIGLSRMFNLKLPANFDSPYRAHNIIDFWRRWHLTLSRFLRNYLYIPLGGNRGSALRRYLNLLITMLLGGLWHGAGWGFVLWGGCNGVYLVINHLWRGFWNLPKDNPAPTQRWRLELGLTVTFVLIMFSRVFFRTSSLEGASRVFAGLAGRGGAGPLLLSAQWQSISLLLVLYAWCRWAPNSQQWLAQKDPVLKPVEHPARWQVQFTRRWGLGLAALTATALLLLNRVSEFLYFQF